MDRSTRHHRRRRLLVFAAVVGTAGALGACGVTTELFGFAVPIEYHAVEVQSGDRGALHALAGLYVSVGNAGERTFASLEVAFDLYLDDAPFPASGRNSFYAPVALRLDPGEAVSLCLSLDSIPGVGGGELSVHRFRARTITFADGSRWRNNGAHVWREDER